MRYKFTRDFAGKKRGDTFEFNSEVYLWSHDGATVSIDKNFSGIEPDRGVVKILEIVSTALHNSNTVWHLTPLGNYSADPVNFNYGTVLTSFALLYQGSCVANGKYEINKISRISDGVAFKVGDAIISKAGVRRIINGFRLGQNYEVSVLAGGIQYFADELELAPEVLTFGGQPVTIVKALGKDVDIISQGVRGKYSDCKKYREAIQVIKDFKFGSKRSIAANKTKAQIGCTIGTIDEMDAILAACEKLLT